MFGFDALSVLMAVYRLHEGELHINLILLLLAICSHVCMPGSGAIWPFSKLLLSEVLAAP